MMSAPTRRRAGALWVSLAIISRGFAVNSSLYLRGMATETRTLSDLRAVFPGDGEMANRCRVFDWGTTSLGPPTEWSPALRIIVAATLESPFAMNLWCGSDLNL